MSKIKVNMYMGRNSRDEYHIQINCDESNTRFLDAYIDADTFAKMITSAHVEFEADVNGLDRVGKRKIRESRSVVVHRDKLNGLGRDAAKEYVKRHCQEDGWLLDSYMGSQSSVVYQPNDMVKLNYAVFKFVEIEDESE